MQIRDLALFIEGSNRLEVSKKVKDLKYMHKLQNKQRMQLGTRANKLQTHFR